MFCTSTCVNTVARVHGQSSSTGPQSITARAGRTGFRTTWLTMRASSLPLPDLRRSQLATLSRPITHALYVVACGSTSARNGACARIASNSFQQYQVLQPGSSIVWWVLGASLRLAKNRPTLSPSVPLSGHSSCSANLTRRRRLHQRSLRSLPINSPSQSASWRGCKGAPNNAFKPKPLRYAAHMAERACHVFRSTARFGLTYALGLCPSHLHTKK